MYVFHRVFLAHDLVLVEKQLFWNLHTGEDRPSGRRLGVISFHQLVKAPLFFVFQSHVVLVGLSLTRGVFTGFLHFLIGLRNDIFVELNRYLLFEPHIVREFVVLCFIK